MYTSSMRDLRADLATAIRRAQRGQETVVTVHGTPAARLVSIGDTAPRPAITLDALIATRNVAAPRRTGSWRPSTAVPIWAGTRIDQALREVRG